MHHYSVIFFHKTDSLTWFKFWIFSAWLSTNLWNRFSWLKDQCVRASVWVFFVRDEDRSVVVSSSGQKKKVLCPKNAKNEWKVKAKRSWQLTTAFTYFYFTDFIMGWNDFVISIHALVCLFVCMYWGYTNSILSNGK